jgi:aryl-alcohol dehydrogenase-like predicted oxidoreductase
MGMARATNSGAVTRVFLCLVGQHGSSHFFGVHGLCRLGWERREGKGQPLRYRDLGGTGIKVSELGFGVWTVATNWWGEHDDASALGLMNAAIDRGVNFFDTSDTYGQGRGETLIADLLQSTPRDSVVISTKFGYDWQNAPNVDGHRESPQDFSVPFVRSALEGSLRRLDTDHIDLWQMHNARQHTLEDDDLFTYLDRVKKDGKVRSVGVALGPAIGWRDEGIYALRERGVDVVQMIYNILEQDPGRELIRTARKVGAGLLVRVPHSSGMLEGKYTVETTFGPNDHRSHRKKEWLIKGLAALDKLSFLTADRTIAQAALRFVLAEPEVSSALPNIYDREQLEEFVSASDVPDLTADELSRLDELFESDFKFDFCVTPQSTDSRPAKAVGEPAGGQQGSRGQAAGIAPVSRAGR